MTCRVHSFLATTVVLSGCATPDAPAPSGEHEVAFSCDNGEQLQVRFSQARGMATLLRNGEAIELPQQPAGSGFAYGNGRTTVRGKGDELTVEVGRMLPFHCRAH